jgi:hypothetical protein
MTNEESLSSCMGRKASYHPWKLANRSTCVTLSLSTHADIAWGIEKEYTCPKFCEYVAAI